MMKEKKYLELNFLSSILALIFNYMPAHIREAPMAKCLQSTWVVRVV